MTNKEQTNLLAIAKLRERVTKSKLEKVGAQLLVDLDRQLDSYYSFDSDETWKEAHRIADEACKEAQTKVKERNRQLGIPDRFAPSLRWSDDDRRRKGTRVNADCLPWQTGFTSNQSA